MRTRYLLAAAIAFEAALGSASAYEVTFEDQPAGPSGFAKAGDAQDLHYSFAGGLTADFRGGVILTNEQAPAADSSNVYATSYMDESLRNPLTITFNEAVSNFQVEITNAFEGSYELYDNKGDRTSFAITTEGTSTVTEGLATPGNKIFIKYRGDCPDFAIDNITFDQPLSMSTVPLPASAPLFGAALMGLGAVGYGLRRNVKAAG